MLWDYHERRRRERNYRFMFRSALTFFVIGVFLAVVGGVRALIGLDPLLMSVGLLIISWSGWSAYLSVTSTVKIIDMDKQEAMHLR